MRKKKKKVHTLTHKRTNTRKEKKVRKLLGNPSNKKTKKYSHTPIQPETNFLQVLDE
jgi:hypothetical protein